MRIVKPSANFMFPEDFETEDRRLDMRLRIEKIARKCYKSEGLIRAGSADKLIQKLLNKKHYPMFDHIHISVLAICDRGVSHEIVRHRLAAYAQESTRYCNYAKGKESSHITYIKPCFFPEIPLGVFDNEATFINEAMRIKNPLPRVNSIGFWFRAVLCSEINYMNMIADGCQPQEARSVLPNSLKTEIVMTYDLTVWRHFFNLRTPHAAHPQMREIMKPLLVKFRENIPYIFDDVGSLL